MQVVQVVQSFGFEKVNEEFQHEYFLGPPRTVYW